ncbi:MAG: ATP-dependent Clp protease proteolytic subunit [Planctomycetaceae bacterium]|nr:ATP-dependent Clp protease proteolytic subunit [Planctomycetota bacterium]NUN52751.1 ATP-dependent Clp protease proteolytic subunit [Planctomycetaceae bacterium]
MTDGAAHVYHGDDEEKGEGAPKGPRGIEERLLKSRTVALFEPITPRSSRKIVTSLLVLEAEDAGAPVTLLINSPGGSVDDGFAIYDALRFISCPVRAVCVGLAASAANIVLLGAPKGSRFSLPNTRILLHQPSTGASGAASDLAITAREILKTRQRLNRLLAEETGQKLERIEEDTNRDYWLSAEEAKEYGLIDRVVASRKDLDRG